MSSPCPHFLQIGVKLSHRHDANLMAVRDYETGRLQSMSDLPRKLRDARDRAGVTNRYLAAKIGVNESTLSLWFSGKRTPLVDNLKQLAEELGVEMAELWNGPEALPTAPPVRALVDIANALSPAQQEALLALARTMQAPKAE